MEIALIAAHAYNRVIGKGGQLPWHLPADLRRFRQLTTGHHVLMGRKTWESINKPLKDRTLLIVTHQRDYRPPVEQGVVVVHSIEEGIELAKQRGETLLFIAGGAQIFQQTIHIASRLYITLIEAQVEGDTYFPQYHTCEWLLVEEQIHPADKRHPYAFRFLVYVRRGHSPSL